MFSQLTRRDVPTDLHEEAENEVKKNVVYQLSMNNNLLKYF